MPKSRALPIEEAIDNLKFDDRKYFGIAEASEVTGLSAQALSNRVARGFMTPTAHLHMGPVWTKEDLGVYLRARQIVGKATV